MPLERDTHSGEITSTVGISDAELMQFVRRLVSDVLRIPIADVTPESNLFALGADSFDVIDLLLRLEEALGVTVPETTVATAGCRVDTLVRGVMAELADRRCTEN